MISPYGDRATQYARGLGDLNAIVAEPPFLPQAYAEAVLRRERGESFYGMLLLSEPRSAKIAALAPAILQAYPDGDMRREVTKSLLSGTITINGKSSEEFFAEPDIGRSLMTKEFYQLCDALLVRSFAEADRLRAYQFRPRPFERVLVVPDVPVVERALPAVPAIVVWAPDVAAEQLGIHAIGLDDFLGDRTFVTAGGEAPPVAGIRWLVAGDAAVAAALATTSCVMTVDTDDPGAAVAFAELGYGVAAPLASGAHEYLRNVQTYDVGELSSIHVAAAIAAGTPASVRERPVAVPPEPERPPSPVPLDALPLVSVVIPTYNRPADLRNCLSYVQAQRYPNVECIVVNDAGTDVADVVAAFPFARLHTLERNSGVTVAEMTGVDLARGRFIQLAADDDCIYPDHIERLVYAMLRCGAAVGHTNGLIRYQRRMPDGSVRTDGFNNATFVSTTTPSEALVSSPVSGQGLMWRNDVFPEIGPWREDCQLADQEVQLRAANRYLFVFVDVTTNEWRVRVGESYATYDPIEEMRKVYAMHPVDGRPVIEARRKLAIENVINRPKRGPVIAPSMWFEPGDVPTSS